MRWILFVVGVVLFSPNWCWASTDCLSFFRQKKYDRAGKCFEDKANALGAPQSLSEVQRYTKGRYLKNAATCYLKTRTPEGKRKAQVALQRYLTEKLYENKTRRQAARRQLRGLQDKQPPRVRRVKKPQTRPKASFHIRVNAPRAKICLQQKNQSDCYSGSTWSKKVPPGSYQLSVTYPKTSPRKQTIFLRSDRTVVFNFYPPSQTKVLSQLQITTQSPTAKLDLSGASLNSRQHTEGISWKLQVAPGTYLLGIQYPDFPRHERVIQVYPQKDLTVALRPPTSILQLDTIPSGAAIYTNGTYRGNSPLKIRLLDGKNLITIRKQCHAPAQRTLHISPNTKPTIQVLLNSEQVYEQWLVQSKQQEKQRIWGWFGLVGGVVVLGVGTAGHLLATTSHANAETQRLRYHESKQQPGNYADAYDKEAATGNAWRTVGHAGTGVGTALLGFGAFQFLRSQLPPASALGCEVPITPTR